MMKPIALGPEIFIMEHFRASRTVPADDIQLGEGSAPPPWAAGQLAPPLQSTPTEDAGLLPDHRTTQRQHASDPPPGLHHQHWRSLFGNAGHGESDSDLQGAPESTATPLAQPVPVSASTASIASASKTATSSLLLPRAAPYTPPARPTYPPGAGLPFSSDI